MEKANLPTEKASEPDETARQPLSENMTPHLERQPSRKIITFAEDTDTVEKSSSQRSSNYKEALSQPAPGLSHRQKLLWLQKRRRPGLWAQCDDCSQWRFLPNILDSYELPKKWYCRLNPDTSNADCSIPETPIRIREEEDLIHSEYSAGSVVWARLPGWPWWPAMVDDCPDTEQFYWLDGFSDIPTHYNVVFFDSTEVTRAWISPENLKPYTKYKDSFKLLLKNKKHKNRLRAAVTQADDASKLLVTDRLHKYSFVARYKGDLNTPKKVTQKDLKKHQKSLKRKFNIEFELSESDDNEFLRSPTPTKNKNMIILGTPKTGGVGSRRRTNNVRDAAPENLLDGKSIDTRLDDKSRRPNSLAVQVGSNTDSALVSECFDNDTSKTYVPENVQSTQSSEIDTMPTDTPDIDIRIGSPNSDGFDF